MKHIDTIVEQNKMFDLLATREAASFLKIMHWFFDYPEKEMSLSDLSSVTGVPKARASKIVSSLVKQGFLMREILGKIWRISCNQNHAYNTSIKVPSHLSYIYHSGILQEVARRFPGARAIILFGSYRKGDDMDTSDIDIAVEVLGNVPLTIEPLMKLPRIGYRKNVQVNIHVFSRKRIDINLFTNIANGIILYGLLEVKP